MPKPEEYERAIKIGTEAIAENIALCREHLRKIVPGASFATSELTTMDGLSLDTSFLPKGNHFVYVAQTLNIEQAGKKFSLEFFSGDHMHVQAQPIVAASAVPENTFWTGDPPKDKKEFVSYGFAVSIDKRYGDAARQAALGHIEGICRWALSLPEKKKTWISKLGSALTKRGMLPDGDEARANMAERAKAGAHSKKTLH